ncbi:hypothetical protein PsorP6_011160 [Peronosclerospora sorghi]|uniref:Uncharacterized protein n=1 Tax=Peronosclerospora sorghi TaxID=230839 RepID=A0ACC0VYY5_9STRA|nr:hypothetical protein PsorP6_011160 [Peronosclerospora sorghi]
MLSSYFIKRSQQPQLWKRTRLVVAISFLLLFLWAQYTALESVPALFNTARRWHSPDNATREDAYLKGNSKRAGSRYADANRTTADQAAVLSDQQEARRVAVREAMKFAWGNYEEHAFGADEVDPISGEKISDVWGNIACSLVDALDTLWIMELKDEFHRARDYVANHLNFSHLGTDGRDISIFETIIREVGGLLSAYDLSGDSVFKEKAKEMMNLLTPAYHEKEGVFYTKFNPYTKKRSFGGLTQRRALIADIGTLQLETRYLSDITGDSKYAEMGNAFYEIVNRKGSYKKTGLFPVYFDTTRGEFDTSARSLITLGGFGDSFYEYLLKVYIYSGNREEDRYLRRLYDDVVKGIEDHLLFYSIQDDLYFLQNIKLPWLTPVYHMDHLACFVPGMLALGTLFETEDHVKNAKHLDLAEKLMKSCYEFYHRQPTGLSPDVVSFPGMRVVDPHYRLRPETIESLFYLYRVTKNSKYRELGWEIFQALETHAKTEHGYAAIRNVTKLPVEQDNKMESFFLAETLKYHYLLQAPESLIPLHEYVFNTEAHPLRIHKDVTS